MSEAILVIPTYNENKTIIPLVTAILERVPTMRILIVDDDSPDGTGELADQLAAQHAGVEVLHRQAKDGLGRAYVAGFTHALQTNAEYILQMDADFSHDPKYLPELLGAIEQADVVLGSRYVKGGGVRNWNIARRMISKFGNMYARLVTGMPYHDLTGGFKCWRKEVLEKVNLETLDSVGYNFQIETTYRAHQHKARITEVPIIFTERMEGKSKFSPHIMLESFWKVALLRIKK